MHYEQLCGAPTSVNDKIFLYYFATLNFDSFYTKICLTVHRWCLKKTPWKFRFEITFWKSETHFSHIQVQDSKNYFKIFLQDAGASGKKHLKGITKAMPKVENIYIYIKWTTRIRTTAQMFSLWRWHNILIPTISFPKLLFSVKNFECYKYKILQGPNFYDLSCTWCCNFSNHRENRDVKYLWNSSLLKVISMTPWWYFQFR